MTDREERLEWRNLWVNGCPACGGVLAEEVDGYRCSSAASLLPWQVRGAACTFFISMEKYVQLKKNRDAARRRRWRASD